MSAFRKLTILELLAVILLSAPSAFAMRDADNQGRWNSPTVNNLADKEVPGFLVNLGPTGARAILTENTFIVKYIFKDSPAVYPLKLDDVITGAFGKPFSKHTFGGSPHGYEGPMMDLGNAIETAEGKDGKLVLNIQRGGAKMDVTVNLEPLGTFNDTFPFNCKKSELIRAKALKYLTEYPDVKNVWQSHAKMAVTLALLTSDDPKQFAVGKRMALGWNEAPGEGTWSWDLAHQLITLSEYNLLTKDASVLPTIKAIVSLIEKAEFNPSSNHAVRQLDQGGFGHAPYMKGDMAGNNGYGAMQYPTALTVIARQEAGKCGVDCNSGLLKDSMEFLHRGTNGVGYLGYGGESFENPNYKKDMSGDNYVGRSGCSLIAHLLTPEFPDSAEYIGKNKTFLEKAYKSMPDGHADSNLGIMWTLMGAAGSADDKVLRKVLDYNKAYFNMMRCFDGSFVLLPGRDYADAGYYMASRYHPTATLALAYGLNNPKLLIQGIQISLPYVNPKALKGKLDTAYKAIVNKNYAEAIAALKGGSAEDTNAAESMLAYVGEQAQQFVFKLDELEKAGDIVRLQAELSKSQKQFGLLQTFKDKVAHFEDALRQDAWKLELKLGANYAQMLEALKRNKTLAYAGDLERFAENYPHSLYGKWALEVAKEYRASGSVKVPSVTIPEKTVAAKGPAASSPDQTASAPSTQSPPTATAAKPTTPVSKAAVAPEVLSEYQTRFIQKLDSSLSKGAKLEVWLSGLGPKSERYGLKKASELGLVIQQGESLLPVPWRSVSPTDRAALAKSMTKDEDVESLLIAAVLHHAVGKNSEAETFLTLAAAKDAESATKTRKDLAPH